MPKRKLSFLTGSKIPSITETTRKSKRRSRLGFLRLKNVRLASFSLRWITLMTKITGASPSRPVARWLPVKP
jgi:hypothetical protein